MSEVKEPAQPVDVYSAINAVMNEVKAVGKEGKNTFDKYNFRGIDGVMNAVGPALRKHGVITVPTVMDCQREKVTTGKGAVMTSVVLRMMVRWYGPGGDYIETIVWGEAFDRGDKATAKAHSVAFRTAILQTLCLPTQEPDPDEFSYEQQAPVLEDSTRTMVKGQIQAATSKGELQELWKSLSKDGLLTEELKKEITARANEVGGDGTA